MAAAAAAAPTSVHIIEIILIFARSEFRNGRKAHAGYGRTRLLIANLPREVRARARARRVLCLFSVMLFRKRNDDGGCGGVSGGVWRVILPTVAAVR